MAKFITKQCPADSLMADMGIDIAVNSEGRVLVLHEKAFQSPVVRLEYQRHNGQLAFAMDDGTIRDFGMAVPTAIQKSLAQAQEAYLFLIERNKVAGYRQVPLNQII